MLEYAEYSMNAGSTAKGECNFGSIMIEIRLKNMTVEQIESILNKLADKAKYEAFSACFFDLMNGIEINQNFLGDKYWICGSYSIGVAKIYTNSKEDYTYRIKLFLQGNYTEKVKQGIPEENYLEDLEWFIDLMLSKIIEK